MILEALSPAERLAFVLHDIFAVPFDEIAPIVERSESATRQLASRARRRVRAGAVIQDVSFPASREVVHAFLAASRAGNFEALFVLLDPDVVYRQDWTTTPSGMAREVRGAASVDKQLLMGHAQAVRPVLVNGTIGVVVAPFGRLLAVATFTITGRKIVQINVISDPKALRQLRLSVLSD